MNKIKWWENNEKRTERLSGLLDSFFLFSFLFFFFALHFKYLIPQDINLPKTPLQRFNIHFDNPSKKCTTGGEKEKTLSLVNYQKGEIIYYESILLTKI